MSSNPLQVISIFSLQAKELTLAFFLLAVSSLWKVG
jgi:hypothetical protein